MASCCAALLLTACVQEGYNYSDVDSTVGMRVDSLVVPLNLDNILLKNVLDIPENSPIKEFNGIYAVVQEGTYSSDEVHIPSFYMPQPEVAPLSMELTPEVTAQAKGMATRAGRVLLAKWPIRNTPTTLKYSANHISDFIVSINRIACEYTLSLNLEVTGMPAAVKSFQIEDLSLQVPKGLECTPSMGVYDAAYGELRLGTVTVTNGRVRIDLKGTGINFNQAGVTLRNHSLNYESPFMVRRGYITLYDDNLNVTEGFQASNIRFVVQPTMTAFNATEFDGELQYSIEGLQIADIDLSDIPDALKQTGTQIGMDNPQIYLSMNNPLGDKQVVANFGMEFVQKYNGQEGQVFHMDNGTMTTATGSNTEIYKYCLAPRQPEEYFAGYEGARFEPFTGLSRLLQGQRIPDALGVRITSPQVQRQRVNGLMLGSNLGRLTGAYQLYTPLALTPQSTVAYVDTLSGWYDDEIELMRIRQLRLTADVTSDLPAALELSALPIDTLGKVVTGVEVITARLSEKAKQEHVTLWIKGDMRNIDGILIKAKATAGTDTRALAPEQYLKLENLRVMATGEIIYKP